MLEYFSSTHGARKGLADTALKTADSGYLTRKLADVAQNVVVTMDDCGTTQGITKGVIYRGEKVEVGLADSVHGRVSRANIVNPITDEVIVRENELITRQIAAKDRGTRPGEDPGPQPHDVRRARWASARCCYGMDLSTGSLVEQGMAVGIIAAQSIGEPGTQLTMRTFHIGGTAARAVEESEIRAKKAASSSSPGSRSSATTAGEQHRPHPKRRNRHPRPPRTRTRTVRSPRRRPTHRRGEPGGRSRRRPLPLGPAQHPHPRRSRRPRPLRRRHRRRDDAHRKGPQRPRRATS